MLSVVSHLVQMLSLLALSATITLRLATRAPDPRAPAAPRALGRLTRPLTMPSVPKAAQAPPALLGLLPRVILHPALNPVKMPLLWPPSVPVLPVRHRTLPLESVLPPPSHLAAGVVETVFGDSRLGLELRPVFGVKYVEQCRRQGRMLNCELLH